MLVVRSGDDAVEVAAQPAPFAPLARRPAPRLALLAAIAALLMVVLVLCTRA